MTEEEVKKQQYNASNWKIESCHFLAPSGHLLGLFAFAKKAKIRIAILSLWAEKLAVVNNTKALCHIPSLSEEKDEDGI